MQVGRESGVTFSNGTNITFQNNKRPKENLYPEVTPSNVSGVATNKFSQQTSTTTYDSSKPVTFQATQLQQQFLKVADNPTAKYTYQETRDASGRVILTSESFSCSTSSNKSIKPNVTFTPFAVECDEDSSSEEGSNDRKTAIGASVVTTLLTVAGIAYFGYRYFTAGPDEAEREYNYIKISLF